MDIDTFDSVELLCDEIMFPVAQLKEYVEGNGSEIRLDRMASVVAFYLRAKIDKLREIADDLDTDVASEN